MNTMRGFYNKIKNTDFGDLKVFRRRLTSLVSLTGGGLVCFCAMGVYGGDARFYSSWVMPAVRLLDPETAHRCGVWLAAHQLLPRAHQSHDPPLLRTSVWGLDLSNPIGLAAGFDKHGEACRGLLRLGFGFVEIGSVTPLPQPGNERPRVFRCHQDSAVINRYGFNSDGHASVAQRLAAFRSQKDCSVQSAVVGVNLGKNKMAEDAAVDFISGLKAFSDTASYFVVNVSSPNTPGLRHMQDGENLEQLLDRTLAARDRLYSARSGQWRPPVLLKIAPDLTAEQKRHIAECCLKRKDRLDGLVVCNTTILRPDNMTSSQRHETGGLSGQPLNKLSTDTIAEMYRLTAGAVVIVGVGGVSSGQDAYDKIRAGASLVQLYTAFSVQGPPVVGAVKQQLAELLRRDGFESVGDAVGAAHRTVAPTSQTTEPAPAVSDK